MSVLTVRKGAFAPGTTTNLNTSGSVANTGNLSANTSIVRVSCTQDTFVAINADADSGSMLIVGGGTEFLAVPQINTATLGTPSIVAGNVVAIPVLSGGAGYGSAPAVTIGGTNVSAATATATLTNGRVTGITILTANQGAGYSPNTITVAIAAPTSNFITALQVANAGIASFTELTGY
jgi:hypothetical protein